MNISCMRLVLWFFVLSCCTRAVSAGGEQPQTPQPTTPEPTPEPSTLGPTLLPSLSPSSLPTDSPTTVPTSDPTTTPTMSPTSAPSSAGTPPSPNSLEEELGPTWGGCVDPNDGNEGIIKIGDRTTVCLTVGAATGNNANWGDGATYLRWVFLPEADQYSRFHIPNSFRDLVANADSSPLGNRNLTVHTASQDFLSFLRVYYDPIQKRVFPYLTAIIDVDDGVVQGIAWDDACVFCSGSRCQENTFNFAGESSVDLDLDEQTKGCYLNVDECRAIAVDTETGESPGGGYEATTGNTCDLNLYVVWTGSDSNGDSFQSSSSRFGAFPESRLQDRVRNNLPDFDFPDVF